MTVLAGLKRTDGGCECRSCMREYVRTQLPPGKIHGGSFIVCPICGNKRCPKATHHDNECTDSNKPGQKGSFYE